MNTPHRTPIPCAAALALLALASPALAQRLVPSQYPTIQAAVDAARSFEEIRVAPGNYRISNPINSRGKPVTIVSEQGAGLTILDGGGTSRLFIMNTGESSRMVVRGLTLRNGKAVDNTNRRGDGGGAVFLRGSSPRFEDCVLENNRAGNGILSSGPGPGGHGGAVAIQNGGPTFSRCIFRNNTAGSGSAGLPGSRGTDGTNSSRNGGTGGTGQPGADGGHGGALYVTGSASVLVDHCLFVDNSAGSAGSGGRGGPGGNGYRQTVLGQTFYVGAGGLGGTGGPGGAAGEGTLYVGIGAAMLVQNCTFGANHPVEGGAPGAGGTGGPGLVRGGTGLPGTPGLDSQVAGIRAFSTAQIHNTVLFDDDTSRSGTRVGVVEVLGSYAADHVASRTALIGNNVLVLTDDQMDSNWVPEADGDLVDTGTDRVPQPTDQDLLRNPRAFDYPWQPGTVDIGAIERSAPDYYALLSCRSYPAESLRTSGLPRLGGSFDVVCFDPLGSLGPNTTAFLFLGAQWSLCGTEVPGFGIDPRVPGYLHLADPETFGSAPIPGRRTAAIFTVAVPNDAALLGSHVGIQSALFDVPASRIALTNATVAVLGR